LGRYKALKIDPASNKIVAKIKDQILIRLGMPSQKYPAIPRNQSVMPAANVKARGALGFFQNIFFKKFCFDFRRGIFFISSP